MIGPPCKRGGGGGGQGVKVTPTFITWPRPLYIVTPIEHFLQFYGDITIYNLKLFNFGGMG